MDDDEAFRALVVGMLRAEGYECEAARNVAEGLALLRDRHYDVLVTDLQMPGNNDMGIVKGLPPQAGDMPVILMTAFPTMESAIDSVNLRVAAYLVKPFDKETLLAKVRPAIRQHRALRVLKSSLKRVTEWKESLEHLEKAAAAASGNSGWQTLMDLTLRNASEALTEARLLSEAVASGGDDGETMRALESTRPMLLLNALRETVFVLDKTRTSFKSKELAELRRKIEPLLKGEI